MENIVMTLGGVLGFAIGIGLYVLPVKMAKKQGRSAIGWLILSFIISAPVALLVLSILGDKKSAFYRNTVSYVNKTNKTSGRLSRRR